MIYNVKIRGKLYAAANLEPACMLDTLRSRFDSIYDTGLTIRYSQNSLNKI